MIKMELGCRGIWLFLPFLFGNEELICEEYEPVEGSPVLLEGPVDFDPFPRVKGIPHKVSLEHKLTRVRNWSERARKFEFFNDGRRLLRVLTLSRRFVAFQHQLNKTQELN